METISKRDYLLLASKARDPILKRDWFVKAFTIIVLKDEDVSKLEYLDICIKADGLYMVGEEAGKLIKILGYKRDEPLYDLQEPFVLTREDFKMVKENALETKVGLVVLNAIFTPPELEEVNPYYNFKINDANDIENDFGSRIRDPDEKKLPDSITLADFKELEGKLKFLEGIGPFVTSGVTMKILSKPKGLDKYKAELLKEYEGQLDDPLKLVELEGKLMEFDAQFLKGDPVSDNAFSRKARLGRFRLHVLQGQKMDFVDDPENDSLFLNSISDGVLTDPKKFATLINDARFGSFARGSLTALAGYIYKILQRALTSLYIEGEPCNTKRGFITVLTKSDAPFTIDREIRVNGKWVLLHTEQEVSPYIGKVVEIRSPMYCKAEGDNICYACLSHKYKNVPGGVTNIASGISMILMVMFLKLMHASAVKSATIEIDDLIN